MEVLRERRHGAWSLLTVLALFPSERCPGQDELESKLLKKGYTGFRVWESKLLKGGYIRDRGLLYRG